MSRLDEVTSRSAYALIRFQDEPTVTLLGGHLSGHETLGDVPLSTGPPPAGRRFDRLLCVPYAQIRERGFAAHADDAALSSIEIDSETTMPLADLMTSLPKVPLATVGPAGFDLADDAYADLVGRVVRDEIGHGEGANLVIARNYRATIAQWDRSRALSVFRRLLEQERGAYWTFLVYIGDRYLIGASPERHLSLRAGELRMNPISGTFRLGPSATEPELKQRLLDFLADEKEVYELFMVVDEELKMMCAICAEGGQILGPYLKPMTHLVHTEYVLSGRTSTDVRDALRSSMYAATVTGSPVENACRLITKYEPTGRGYYGAMLALLGRDQGGSATVDAPILLRTADVSAAGELRVTAGATLVRDSDPAAEVAETAAKAAGILTAFGLVPDAANANSTVEALTVDEDVQLALESRNSRLSRFWFTDQSGASPSPELSGRTAVILDGEDNFVTMLQHMLGVLGMSSRLIRSTQYRTGAFDDADLVIVGPGPGDPRASTDPKIASVRAAVDDLLTAGRPFLAVCLGHQVLCSALGIPLAVKDVVFQGVQTRVELFGRSENVGFYNTFVARVDAETRLPAGVEVGIDPTTGDVHHIEGPHFHGIQFHAESILTEHGFEIVTELLLALTTASRRHCSEQLGPGQSASEPNVTLT